MLWKIVNFYHRLLRVSCSSDFSTTFPKTKKKQVSTAASGDSREPATYSRKSKFVSPPPDTTGGRAASKRSSKQVWAAHPDPCRLCHYEDELKEVIDAACTLLSVYLFVENAFPGDEVLPVSTMEDGSQGPVKWRRVLDHFFHEAVHGNEDADQAGRFQLPLVSPY